MKVLDIVLDIKDNASRIGDAAGDDQPEASGIDVVLEKVSKTKTIIQPIVR